MNPYPLLLTLALLAPPGATAAANLGAESFPQEPSALPELPSIESGDDKMLSTTLQLGYAINRLGPQANPDEKDIVRLRTYNGRLIGPTLRVRPGDTLSVTLVNQLPCLNPPCICKDGPALEHHHVETARDTLSAIPPSAIFNTTNLHTHGLHVTPKDPGDNVLREVVPGCSWSFRFEIPANHPSGTFWYHPHVHGATAIQVGSGAVGALIVEGTGLDLVPEIRAARERVLVFQQIPYTCTAKQTDPKARCTETDPGRVEDFTNDFGNGKWPKTWQYTTINGEIQPVIYLQPGEVQRWRSIHGGIRESINLAVADANSTILSGWLNEIALDGLPTGEITPRLSVELQPGYRSDLLVKAPAQPGVYYLLDKAAPAAEALLAEPESQKILGVIVVQGTRVDMKLPESSQLARFRLPSVTDAEVAGRTQTVEFDIANGKFTVDGEEYPAGKTRCLELGKADEWLVTSTQTASHPFHIHVNPFEVIEPLPGGGTRRYWKDTLLVKQGQTVRLRSRYEVFDGPFVLHCHILDHEDRGMMQMVEIVRGTCPK